MQAEEAPNVFVEWGGRIDWTARVKAVCKPCWELKYCPYGVLVEDFPLPDPEDPDERACRIFGHICPVFSVAEPFTETRELRNISRRIPRDVQFRVLKRDHQICAICEKPVSDSDIHFDHIIPWSKGGPTEEHNIRLLCSGCNRKKGNRFEPDHLVYSFVEHTQTPLEVSMVKFLRDVVDASHEWEQEHGRLPSGPEILSIFAPDEEPSRFEEMLSDFVRGLREVMAGQRPAELTLSEFRGLRHRWGVPDQCVRSIAEASSVARVDGLALVRAEWLLLRRLGWDIEWNKASRKRWLTY